MRAQKYILYMAVPLVLLVLLIGCGELDIPMEQKAVEQWKQREPDCETVLFSGAGHLVNLDAPQAFQESLERFWTMERKRG